MSQTVAQKWDDKYASATLKTPVNPCFVLKQHSRLLPFSGKALEVACGLGGNARFLALCGLKTQAWDISDTALTLLNNWASINKLPIEPLLTDLEQMILPYQQFDVIVVSRYLDRSLFPQLASALKPKGLLIYQTFLAPGHASAPSNPDFYVQPGEFNHAWPDLNTLVYGEGWLGDESSVNSNGEKQRYAWYIGQKS